MPCDAAPCPAVRCYSVLRCALFRTCSSTRYHAMYPVTGMYVCVHSSLCFLRLNVLSRSVLPLRPRKLHPYFRSEGDIANTHTTEHSTGQSALLCSADVARGVIKSLVAPNHGPLFAPLYSWRERSGWPRTAPFGVFFRIPFPLHIVRGVRVSWRQICRLTASCLLTDNRQGCHSSRTSSQLIS